LPEPKLSLQGGGRTSGVDCFLTEPGFCSDVAGLLGRSGTIARGLGRSYGDCALNVNGQVIGTTRMDRFLAFDVATGTLVCEAGTNLESIISSFAPRGWFRMITPGTKFVTVAG
jgi:decaprenylphospho-beta-D-ribofuranose 2-oxidase